MPSALAIPARPAERWNTLQILKASRVLLLALDALLLLAIIVGAGVHRNAMKIVGKDTAPSIIAAQHIKAALADMDADLANELLVPAGTADPSPGGFDQRRVEASEALITAAKNITYGPAEELPIEDIQVTSGTYERLAQEARDLEDEGQAEMSMRFYRAGAIVMDGTVLPAADQLDQANTDELEHSYDSESTHSFVARLLIALVALVTLLAMAWSQIFLSRRTHRTLNPALFVATLLTFGLAAYAFANVSSEEHDLRLAKQDAFTSIHALWRARATAYSANGAESRYLLDPVHASQYKPEHQAEFVARTSALATLPPGVSSSQLVAQAARGVPIPGFTGYLADELNNVTFLGERQAAVRLLDAFLRYMAIDAEIRRLETAGKHPEAIALCIGDSPGQSDWAFAQFDQALQQTLDINQQAFDGAVKRGFDALLGMEWKASIVAVLIAVLILLGLAPRIREYE